MPHLQLIALLSYAVLALCTTVVLGRSLYRNGEVFIATVLPTRAHLVKPINKVLLVGFYLVNMAFVLLYLSRGNTEVQSLAQVLAFVASKWGFVCVVLGIWHYGNIAILLSIEFIIKLYTSWKIK